MPPVNDSAIAELLAAVQKPARYTGGEYNQVLRDEAEFRMAVCYPDLYEVGMSNHGIRILYDIVNSMEGVACERVFSVDVDMERRLRALAFRFSRSKPVRRTPGSICCLQPVAPSFFYTNMLQVLDLGGIPLLARDRTIPGRSLSPEESRCATRRRWGISVDAFFMGDGEKASLRSSNVFYPRNERRATRAEKLTLLDRIEAYMFHRCIRFVAKVEGCPRSRGKTRPEKVLPRAGAVIFRCTRLCRNRVAQDRAIVEVTRGCSNMCRFCHAGYYDLPAGSITRGSFADGIMTVLEKSGYDELTLASLSISD